MMKKNKLKGFTLVELIVVIAVFGLLIAATLSFIEPTRKIFKNTQEQASNTMLIDNVQRTVGDRIRFANRLMVRVGPIAADASESDIEAYAQSQVNELRDKFCLGDGNSAGRKRIEYAKDTVYVMRVNNPEDYGTDEDHPFKSFAANSDDPPGKISLWKYNNGTMSLSESREWLITKGEYSDVSFALSFNGVETVTSEIGNYDRRNLVNKLEFNTVSGSIAPSLFRMHLDIYTNRYNSARTEYDLCTTSASVDIPIALVNTTTSTTTKTDEYTYKVGTDPTPKSLLPSEIPQTLRYHFQALNNSNDIYFIYTLPEFGS